MSNTRVKNDSAATAVSSAARCVVARVRLDRVLEKVKHQSREGIRKIVHRENKKPRGVHLGKHLGEGGYGGFRWKISLLSTAA